jgi:hypothetical protein
MTPTRSFREPHKDQPLPEPWWKIRRQDRTLQGTFSIDEKRNKTMVLAALPLDWNNGHWTSTLLDSSLYWEDSPLDLSLSMNLARLPAIRLPCVTAAAQEPALTGSFP